MISKPSLTEAVAALSTVLTSLQQSAQGNTGTSGAELLYAVSLLQAGSAAKIVAGALSVDLANCFVLAVSAGATMPSMLAVYTSATALTPKSKPAIAVVAACRSYAVIAMTRILNAATFTSRDDVDAAIAQIGNAFDAVESAAGNALQTPLYRALIALHAATTANLTTQSYPLPNLVTYSVGRTMSALGLAYRLYGDASRAAEIAAANNVFNPAFMPLTGQVLSA